MSSRVSLSVNFVVKQLIIEIKAKQKYSCVRSLIHCMNIFIEKISELFHESQVDMEQK